MELPSVKPVGAPARATLPLMGVRGVTVEYPGVRALDNVTVDFMAGDIHAIVGENGAGKSTLMKVLSGALTPNAGELLRNGEPSTLRGPRAAIRAGISMVHQELNLVATLSVAENVLLGREPTFLAGIAVDRSQQRERARALLAMLGKQQRQGVQERGERGVFVADDGDGLVLHDGPFRHRDSGPRGCGRRPAGTRA